MDSFRIAAISVLLALGNMGRSVGLSSAETSTSSFTSTLSIATSSDDFQPQPTNYVWHMPLIGLSDSASTPWGAVVYNDQQKTEKTYSIVVNNSNPVPPKSTWTPWPWVIEYAAINANSTGDSLVVTTNGDPTLVLGLNSTLNITSPGLPWDVPIPTVPFGLNYGQKGVWNGGLILGNSNISASYDANRVKYGQWYFLPESANGTGTILQSGRQALANVSIQQWNTTVSGSNYSSTLFGGSNPIGQPIFSSAIIDLNHDALVLPEGTNLCNNSNFAIALNAQTLYGGNNTYSSNDPSYPSYASPFYVEFPPSLTRSTDRCTTWDSTTTSKPIILGRPFLQAAYLMLPDQTGQIWLTGANNFDLPPSPQLFNPTQGLEWPFTPDQPSPTATATASPSPDAAPGPNLRTILGPTLGLAAAITIAAVALACSNRRRRARGAPTYAMLLQDRSLWKSKTRSATPRSDSPAALDASPRG